MEETIHVDGISNLEIVQQRVSAVNENDSTTAAAHVVPLVYIQPNKVQHTSPLNQQISTSALQIVNSSTSTAAIINPINAPVNIFQMLGFISIYKNNLLHFCTML